MKSKIIFNKIWVVIPFFSSIVIMIGIFAFHNGLLTSDIIIADMRSQYIGFFGNYMDILHGKETILYSFSNGLGQSSLMNYYYYLSSPINLILIFFSKKNIINGIFTIILIKIGLSAMTMSYYLGKYKMSKKMILLFSLCYSLMNYTIAFYSNIMWFDAIYLLPLLLYSIDVFIKTNSARKYIILLVILIFSNYYIAYMCIIFSLLYYLWQADFSIKKTLKFLLINLKGVLYCSFIIIPLLYNILSIYNGRGVDYVYLNNVSEHIKIVFKLMFQLLPFASNQYGFLARYAPNIYCSTFVLIMVIGFLCFIKKSQYNRKKTIGIILIFIICFTTNIGNLFMSGFSYPFGYYFRYSFLFSTLLIIISSEAYCNNMLKILNVKNKVLFIGSISYIFVLYIVNKYLSLNYYNEMFIINGLFIFSYLFIIKFSNKLSQTKTETILLIIVISELLLNGINNIYIQRYEGYTYNLKKMNEYCDIITSNEYRETLNSFYSKNIALLCNKHGTEYSSSNINYNVKKFYQKTGNYVSGSYYAISSSNTNLLKKILFIKSEESKNNNDLSIGFMISNSKKNKKINDSNPFEYQNKIISSMMGTNLNILIPYNKTLDNEYYIHNHDDMYLYMTHNFIDNVFGYKFSLTGYINDEKKFNYQFYNQELGIKKIKNIYYTKNIKINITDDFNSKNEFTNKYYNPSEIYVYYEDENVLNSIVEELSKHKLKITKWEKNILEGDIDVRERKTLFLSIPYEEGWNIYVDGKKVKYFKLYDAFIGVNLSKGHHEIKMKFYPKGLKEGIIISIISFLTSICIIIKKIRLEKRF